MNRKHVGSKYSPPWLRRGGRDINKNGAKPPLMKRTGWLVQLPIIRWFERTTPSARTKEASRNLLIAQPPLLGQGGEYSLQPFDKPFVHTFFSPRSAHAVAQQFSNPNAG